MRLIDADVLSGLLREQKIKQTGVRSEGFNSALNIAISIARNPDACPTVDAEPVKRGRWIGTADGYADGELVYDIWECSECGYDADGADEKPCWNYCPNCGAKMDGERKET